MNGYHQYSFDELSRSLASRLLSGTGRASALFYKENPEFEIGSLLHGMSVDDEFLIAYVAQDSDPANKMETVNPVRIEIIRECMDPSIRVVTASAHVLGQVEWISLADGKEMLSAGKLPERFASFVAETKVRIGIVSIDKLLLHQPSGVTRICPESITASTRAVSFPTLSDEIDCSMSLGTNDVLRKVCIAVENGVLPGKICGRCPQASICQHIANKVVCADIDSLGVTLTHIKNDEITTVFAAFDKPVKDIKEFEYELLKIKNSSLAE